MKEKLERNIKITKEALSGKTQYELAKKYDLHPNRIYQIIKNTKVKHTIKIDIHEKN